MNEKRMYKICWIIVFIVLYFVFCFSAVKVLGISFDFPASIQKNYPKYLIETNDKMITSMVEFQNLTKNAKRVFSDEEKEKISKSIQDKNNIMINLQKHPPNSANSAYDSLYKDVLKTYAMYIQGEVMRMEYISAYKKEYTPEEKKQGLVASDETYVMGVQLCDMMGNAILENTSAINKIKNTNIQSKYSAESLEEFSKEIETKKSSSSSVNSKTTVSSSGNVK